MLCAVRRPLRSARHWPADRHRLDDVRYHSAASGSTCHAGAHRHRPAVAGRTSLYGRRAEPDLRWSRRFLSRHAVPGGARDVRHGLGRLSDAQRFAGGIGQHAHGRRPPRHESSGPRSLHAGDLRRSRNLHDEGCHGAGRSSGGKPTCPVVRCINQVLGRLSEPPATIVIAGQGEFLARRLIERLKLADQVVSLNHELGGAVSRMRHGTRSGGVRARRKCGMTMGRTLRVVKLGGSLLDLPDLAARWQRWLAAQACGKYRIDRRRWTNCRGFAQRWMMSIRCR